MPIYDVYSPPGPTSGTTADYVYSRHIAEPGRRKTYAFALETGPDLGRWNEKESFQPSDCQSQSTSDGDQGGPTDPDGADRCGIDYIGTTVFDRPEIVEAMADMRDDDMARTAPGRDWLDLFERLQGPVLSAALADESIMKQAARLFEAVADLVEDDAAKSPMTT